MSKLEELFSTTVAAAKIGALGSLPEWAIYRTPLRRRWAEFRGHHFHRNSLARYVEADGLHTRIALLSARLRFDYPEALSYDLETEFRAADGRLVHSAAVRGLPTEGVYVIDSRHPGELAPKGPFEGSILLKQRIHASEEAIRRKQGLFSTTHTYLDYFRDGGSVATLHDYSAWLPDQPFSRAALGMIPAYLDDEKETFLFIHASRPGIGRHDLGAALVRDDGNRLEALIPPMRPFATAKLPLSKLFPRAKEFLRGKRAQIVVDGVFRELFTRIAYGVESLDGRSFSFDHCYYDLFPRANPLSGEHRRKVAKGVFNPFAVFEGNGRTTKALIFGSRRNPGSSLFDVLVYDEAGKLAAKRSPAGGPTGDGVFEISIGEVLGSAGIIGAFTGHAEVLCHYSPEISEYERELHLTVEYKHPAGYAHVLFGGDVWNPPTPSRNERYRSACRIVCDRTHTTDLAITNCSYSYEYDRKTPFTLTLLDAAGKPLASKRFELGPNATFFRAVDEVFPDAVKLLGPSGGVGLTATTDIDCSVLTHLFFTRDRASGAFSAEHSLDF